LGEKKRRATSGAQLLADAQAMLHAQRFAEARALYERVLDAAPAQVKAWQGLATLAQLARAPDTALRILAAAVARVPESAELRVALAHALADAGRMQQAAAELEHACRLRPDDAPAWESLGIARQSQGDTAAALEAYRCACAIAPTAAARLKLATLVSPIAESRASIAAERARVDAELDALCADPTLHIDDPLRTSPWPNFYLAFQGENDRALMEKYAAAYRRLAPSLEFTAPHCARPRAAGSRIRVGLLSKFFCNHSIGRTSRGLFEQISRAEFEVTAIFVAPVVDDHYSRFIRAHAEQTIVVPEDLGQARQAIAGLELDVLFYQDIGMEPFSYFLAFSRLARVQCVSYGHPDTTGIPAMDFFVSNDLYETPGSPAHYSERLFMLSNLPTLAYYYRPTLPQPPKRRADFGLAGADHLYLCPQNLFKFHPDMDALIADILRRDARGRLVVIEGRVPHWTELLRARWARAFPDVLARVVFLPRQDSADYVNLIALSDVMLDTVHFNGMNTSLEALSVGTPVVTWPGEFQRGRHTQAMYARMGMRECIARDAAHYVDIAVRLATDAEHGAATRREILRRNGVLYENSDVVREFERFFRETLAAT
jgi:protein O-GlcNAc transferase